MDEWMDSGRKGKGGIAGKYIWVRGKHDVRWHSGMVI